MSQTWWIHNLMSQSNILNQTECDGGCWTVTGSGNNGKVSKQSGLTNLKKKQLMENDALFDQIVKGSNSIFFFKWRGSLITGTIVASPIEVHDLRKSRCEAIHWFANLLMEWYPWSPSMSATSRGMRIDVYGSWWMSNKLQQLINNGHEMLTQTCSYYKRRMAMEQHSGRWWHPQFHVGWIICP